MEQFKVGDCVQLKSSDLRMVINTIQSNDMVICQYQKPDGALVTITVNLSSLKRCNDGDISVW